jgi:hypothetical protein
MIKTFSGLTGWCGPLGELMEIFSIYNVALFGPSRVTSKKYL